jgi:putative transposase
LLTVATEKRDPWLANNNAHRLLHQAWSEAGAWLVGDYLLMPDHLHCFCAPHDLGVSIETWIAYWKREFSLKRKGLAPVAVEPRLAGTLAPPGTMSDKIAKGRGDLRQGTRPAWKFQSRGWHHRLRSGESYAVKWLYVQENPLRKNLCQRMEDWPYKGRVFDLFWTGQ